MKERLSSVEGMSKLEVLLVLKRQANVQNIISSRANMLLAEAKTEEAYTTLLMSLYKEQFEVDLTEQVNIDAEIKREKEREAKELDEAKAKAKILQNGV